MKILVLDNYDSFVYNLVYILKELGGDVDVFRNDKISVEDVNNFIDNAGSDSNVRSQLVQSISNAINPNLPDSQVDQYFSNMNMPQGSPLSSDLQTDYNNAKNNINSLLGITPPSQQFGYSADPYGGLMANNLTTNPYNIDYLRRLGLI